MTSLPANWRHWISWPMWIVSLLPWREKKLNGRIWFLLLLFFSVENFDFFLEEVPFFLVRVWFFWGEGQLKKKKNWEGSKKLSWWWGPNLFFSWNFLRVTENFLIGESTFIIIFIYFLQLKKLKIVSRSRKFFGEKVFFFLIFLFLFE